MSTSPILIALAVLFLAYSNGANDNFKSVATLFGSGAATYRLALAWATVSTLTGSLLALLLAHGLVDTFKGKGLIPDGISAQPAFLLAVSVGAGLTVLLATRIGMPVSTTHALTGSLVGASACAAPAELHLETLGTSFVAPLLLSPVLALLATIMVYPLLRRLRRVLGVTSQSCICVGTTCNEAAVEENGSLKSLPGSPVTIGQFHECAEFYQGHMLGLDAGIIVDGLHFLSAGAVGFMRGLNDTPKIVALLLAANALSPGPALALVAFVMAAGGVLHARKMADMMGRKITHMNPGQGLTANLITSLLVLLASTLALPVSTTHVAVGSLFGIGVVNRTARTRTILSILVAWITTLPMGAALAAGAFLFLRP